jgi:hypothetical protein
MLMESHLLRHGNTVTGLVMTFSKPLDPATAQDLGNYAVIPQGPGAGDGAVTAAVYDAARDSVTLILAQPVTIRPRQGLAAGFAEFVVEDPSGANGGYATGITDTSGQALDSNGDGLPDGRLLAEFKARGSFLNVLSGAYDWAEQARLSAMADKAAFPYGHGLFGKIYNVVTYLGTGR